MLVKSPGQAGPIQPTEQQEPTNYQQTMLDGLKKHADGLAEGARFSLYFSAEDKPQLDAMLDAAQKVGAEAAKLWPDMTPNLRLINGNEVVVSLFNTKDPAQIHMLKRGIQ